MTDSLQKREKTYAKLFEKVKSLLENLSKSNRKVYIAEEPTSYSIFQTIWDNIRSNDCLGSSIVQVDTVNGISRIVLVNVADKYLKKYSEEKKKSEFAKLFKEVKEARNKHVQGNEKELKLQDWCEDQVNSAFSDEMECLKANHFVNAKHIFTYRLSVTKSYIEKS